MVVATTIAEGALRTRPQDGLVGLGLEGLSIEPHFNFLRCLSNDGLKSQFGFFVEDDAKNAELTFGGYNRERFDPPLAWVPVAAPEIGHWLLTITGVRVGSQKLEMCRSGSGCRGMIDTSSPGINIPEDLAPELMDLVAPDVVGGVMCALPDLSLELEGGVTLTLRVEDYAGPRCEPEIRTHGFGEDIVGAQLIILGEPMIRRYYTVFDWGAMRLGFAMARVARSCQRLSAAGLPAGPGDCQGSVEPFEDELMLNQMRTHEEA